MVKQGKQGKQGKEGVIMIFIKKGTLQELLPFLLQDVGLNPKGISYKGIDNNCREMVFFRYQELSGSLDDHLQLAVGDKLYRFDKATLELVEESRILRTEDMTPEQRRLHNAELLGLCLCVDPDN